MSRDTIEVMSTLRGEPYWMTEFRLRSYDIFKNRPTPNWGCDLSKIDFRNIYCQASTSKKPESVAYSSDRFGTINTERRKFLPSTVIQPEYQVVCCELKEDLEKEGIIFVEFSPFLQYQDNSNLNNPKALHSFTAQFITLIF